MFKMTSFFVLAVLMPSVAAASNPNSGQLRINGILNNGSCGDDSCSVRVCSVEKMICVYYVCKDGGCATMRKEKLSKEDIDQALRDANSKK